MAAPRLDILSMLAHDLKAPVLAIEQACAMFRDGLLGEVAPEQGETVELIAANAATLERMVADFLDIVRCVEGAVRLRMEQVDLAAVARTVGREMAPLLEASQVSYEVAVAGSPERIWADGGQIHRVVTNLVVNALRYSPPGGRIQVEVEQEGPVARLSLSDEGPGIPEAELEAVFGRFWQGERSASSGNAGLGLFLCRAIVDQHGGRIWAENRPEGGARFRVELPVDRRARRREAAATGAAAG